MSCQAGLDYKPLDLCSLSSKRQAIMHTCGTDHLIFDRRFGSKKVFLILLNVCVEHCCASKANGEGSV